MIDLSFRTFLLSNNKMRLILNESERKSPLIAVAEQYTAACKAFKDLAKLSQYSKKQIK